MRAEEYVQLESDIAALLDQIDADRDAFATTHRGFSDAYVRSRGHNDEVSLAAGFLGVRLAANCFDERNGYPFNEYVTSWIDRELKRVGTE